MIRLALCLLLTLTGCATVREVSSSTDTFAICKSTDVITTKIALNSGKFHEANRLLAPFIGPHNFTPLILFSVGVYLLLRYVDDEQVTMFANAVTCGVATRNAVLINDAGLLH